MLAGSLLRMWGKVDETVEYQSRGSGRGTPRSENLGKRFPFVNPEYNIILVSTAGVG